MQTANKITIYIKNRIVICSYLCSIILFLLLLSACKRTANPQLPSNKSEVDSVAVALLETNQRLSLMAQKELTSYVLESQKPFVQDNYGFWYLITDRKEGELLDANQIYTIHQKIFLMDGTLCEDAIVSCQLGKKQVITAVDQTLRLLKVGEKVEILTPWYLAFGQQGNRELHIGAYSNLRIELDVLDY